MALRAPGELKFQQSCCKQARWSSGLPDEFIDLDRTRGKEFENANPQMLDFTFVAGGLFQIPGVVGFPETMSQHRPQPRQDVIRRFSEGRAIADKTIGPLCSWIERRAR